MTPATTEQIAAAIERQQNARFIPTACEAVLGGDINRSYLLRNSDSTYFVKTNTRSRLSMLETEAHSLRVLREHAEVLTVPKVVAFGLTNECAYLVLEYHEMQSHGNSRLLARGLCELHRHSSPDGRFGWREDNFIGTSPQRNNWHTRWDDFWWQERLLPQLEMAYQAGYGTLQAYAQQLAERLPELWGDYTPTPSLLHGDLWGGNAAYLRSGDPAIYDPASYYGDRETDVAMTELFGGFPPEFYNEYAKLWPLPEGYEWRKKLYNLYHLLNHLNLFGSAYLSQCQDLLKQLATGSISDDSEL